MDDKSAEGSIEKNEPPKPWYDNSIYRMIDNELEEDYPNWPDDLALGIDRFMNKYYRDQPGMWIYVEPLINLKNKQTNSNTPASA